jgi:hypothetical protein
MTWKPSRRWCLLAKKKKKNVFTNYSNRFSQAARDLSNNSNMWQHAVVRCSPRSFSTLNSSLLSPPRVPWFVDPQETSSAPRVPPQPGTPSPIPPGVPPALRVLYAQLCQSPYLEPSALLVRDPIIRPPGPPLPVAIPKGRRKRGRTYAGEGFLEPGGIWSWILLAQVQTAL